MTKKYELGWRDSQQNVLDVNVLEKLSIAVLLSSILEALEMMHAIPHEVVLFINSELHYIESSDMGRLRDDFFSLLPKPPGNFRHAIILPHPDQRVMLMVAFELLVRMFFGEKLALHFAHDVEEAENLIKTFTPN